MRLRVDVIILSLLITSVPRAAQNIVQAPIQGGPGGNYFDYPCGQGRVLVGLRGSAGVWIDSVQAICARVDASGAVVDPQPQRQTYGGSRPIDKTVTCPSQMAVISASISETEKQPFAGSIRLTCRQISRWTDGGSETVELRGSGHLRGYLTPVGGGNAIEGDFRASSCPSQSYAVGISGRSSSYLDAFGLMCGPKPSAAPAGATANLVGSEVSFQAS